MTEQILRGKINFKNDDQYDCDFTAILGKTKLREYGNCTAVSVKFGKMKNGKKREDFYLDTRYVVRIQDAFKEWLLSAFSLAFEDHTITFYDDENETEVKK